MGESPASVTRSFSYVGGESPASVTRSFYYVGGESPNNGGESPAMQSSRGVGNPTINRLEQQLANEEAAYEQELRAKLKTLQGRRAALKENDGV